MKAAAAAVRHGWDPIRYLDLEGVEEKVATRVLQLAEDIDLEQRRDLIKAVQVAVQNGVARAFKGGR